MNQKAFSANEISLIPSLTSSGGTNESMSRKGLPDSNEAGPVPDPAVQLRAILTS